jgi:hypothetical protein
MSPASTHSSAVSRKVDVRLPGKGNLNSHGARPVHLIVTMIKWILTRRLAIKNSFLLRFEAWGVGFGMDRPASRHIGPPQERRVPERKHKISANPFYRSARRWPTLGAFKT